MTSHPSHLVLAFALAASAVAWDMAARAEEDELSLGVRTTAPLPPADQRAKFKLPPGFEIQLVAAEPDINKPFNMAFDAAGRLWTTTSIEYPWAAPTNRVGRDRLMIFEDFGPDGRARKVTQFADGLNIPIGIYPFRTDDKHWKAVVWSIPDIWLLEDTDGDGKADKRTVLYGPFDHTRDTHGNQASFRRGFDGWLYATHGYNNDSHVTARDGSHVDLNSGNTYRIRLDGSRIEQHTHGQVNPFGLAWDARGNLYSSDCHSAPIYQLLDGGWYPSFGKPHDGLGYAPVMLEHAHGSTAIDGAFYYNDDLWPAEYQDTFFIGNVMTSRLNRDKITFTGSTPKATEQPDFLTTTDPWFRPVDNILGPDGALYIADFYNRIIGHYEVPLVHPGRDRERGRIWRVVYKGDRAEAKLRPAALPRDLDGLIGELGSPNLTRQMLALNQLTDEWGTKAGDALEDVFNNCYWQKRKLALPEVAVRDRMRVQAMWGLRRLGHLNATLLRLIVKETEAFPLFRVHLMRVMTDIAQEASRTKISPEEAGQLHDLLNLIALPALKDSDALVRRCAVEALGKGPAFDNLRPLLDLRANVPAEDTHLLYVVRKAIRDQLEVPAIFEQVLAKADWPASDLRALMDVAVAVRSPQAGSFVLQHLDLLGKDVERLAPALEYAARQAPEADLPKVGAYARMRFADDLNWRMSLFNWMQAGLDKRGSEMPPAIRDWGTQLAQEALDSLDANTLAWTSAPVEGINNMAPWKYEERTCADGKKILALSSLPLSERFTGVLRSPVFAAPRQLSFWLCGHDGFPGKPAGKMNVVRLHAAPARSLIGRSDSAADDSSVPSIAAAAKMAALHEAAPPRNDIAQQITWDLRAHEGQPVYLEVTDADDGAAYAWLAFGRFDPPVLTLPAVPPAEVTQRHGFAAQLAAKLHLTAFGPRLREVLDNPLAELLDRSYAASALAVLEPEPTARRLATILGDGTQSTTVREDLGWAMAELNTDFSRTTLLAAMKSVPARTQQRWAVMMASRKEGAEALLKGVEQGQVSVHVLQSPDVKNRLQSSRPAAWEARLTRLTQDLQPMDEARGKLIAARMDAFRAAPVADPAEGRRVFDANCAACHQLEGKGGLVGPQLTGIGVRGVERLCEDVLDPNRNVDRAFRQTVVVLKDGDVQSGLFRREEGDLLVFADGTGKEFSLKKADVAERKESDLSLMPENLGETIPVAQFNQLLAYLLSQRPGK